MRERYGGREGRREKGKNEGGELKKKTKRKGEKDDSKMLYKDKK